MTFQAWPKRLPCLHLLSNRKARVPRIYLFPESLIGGVHDALFFQDSCELLGDGYIDDWDPRNRASFRMLTKIGRGASWLISVMIPANLTMKSAFGTNMRFCPLNSDANEIQMWIVTLVNVAVLVRRKVNASVANFKNSSGFSRDS